MRTNKTIVFLASIAAGLILLASCRKELDSPPEQNLPVGSVITLDSLRNLFTGTPVHFDTTTYSVYATVTADESNGNLYKQVYVQDGDAAINVRLLNSGGLYQGDRIRIYLPGTVLSSYNGMLQLDSVDVDNNIVKQDVDVWVEPSNVSVAQINSSWQGRLVRLVDSVEFIDGELGLTYAIQSGTSSQNRTLQDCNGDQIIVRTSDFANFAGLPLPTGRGPFIAVVGQFNSTMQLYIRDLSEVQLNSPRCDGSSGGPCPAAASVLEDFTTVVQYDPIDLTCWRNIATAGTVTWEGGTFSGTTFARAEAYNSGEVSNVMWLVSPPVNYTSGMALSFLTEKAYWSADPFAVLISTNFDGSSISGATWTPITAPHATNADADYTWVPSGDIDLVPYLPGGFTGSFVIAFRYTGGDPSNTTRYDIDDVQIQ